MHIAIWHVNFDFVVGFSILFYTKKTHTITHIQKGIIHRYVVINSHFVRLYE